MDNNHIVNGTGIPMGLGMALAQNNKAMQHFASLPAQEQQTIIENTHNIRSKQEMQSFVNSLIRE